MKPPLSLLPALPCAVGLALGIICANAGWPLWAISSGTVAFAALCFLKRRYLSFFALMLAIGAALAWARSPQRVPDSICDRTMQFSCEVLSATPGANAMQCVWLLDSCQGEPIEPLKCVVSVREYVPGLEPGARAVVNAKLVALNGQNLLPYEADYQKFLKYEGITCRAWILPAGKEEGLLSKGESVVVTSKAAGWRSMIYKVRTVLAEAIVDSPIDGETASFLLATIIGEDSYLEVGVRDSFSAVGLSHALALSGLHVGVIAGLLAFLLFPTRFFRAGFYLRPILTGLLIWGYALLVGMGPSVTRAAAMLSVFIAARLAQRGSNPFNSLCLAAIVVMALNPYSIFTPGFQLSFAAVLSILLFCRIEPQWLRRRPVARYLAGLFTVPVAAMLGTGLIGAYYFHVVPWLFLLANALVGILLPILLAVGALLMLFTLCGVSVGWLGVVANGVCAFMTQWARWLASLGAQSDGVFFSPWAILPFMLALVLAGMALRRRKLALWCASAAMFAASAVIILGWKDEAPSAELYVPSGREGALIVRSGAQARLVMMDDGIDSAAVAEEYASRFKLFLLARGCDTLRYMAEGEQIGPFYYKNGVLVAGDKTIAIITAHRPRVRTDYAIVGRGFTGNAADLNMADTILFSQTLSPARAKKLRSDLPQPSRDLRTQPLRLTPK